VKTRQFTFSADREQARSLLRTAIRSRLLQLPARGKLRVILDTRSLAIELAETLSEPRYADALRILSEGRR
jgi:hypothetical protein